MNIDLEQYEMAKKIFDILENDIIMRELLEENKYKKNPVVEFDETYRSYILKYGLSLSRSVWFTITFFKQEALMKYKFLLFVNDYELTKEFDDRDEFLIFGSSYDKLLSAVKVLMDICLEKKSWGN